MFEEELKETKNPAVKRIGNYLMERAKTDPSVANNLKKEKKSLNECWDYVLSEVAKTMYRSGNFGCAAGDDEELFGLAVHYYDEDDIKFEPFKGAKVVDMSKQQQDKKVESKEQKAKEEQPLKEVKQNRVKTVKKHKSDPVDGQLSLF
ncbi:MAG: Cas9 inhibitor AcrIIA9 family protein [Clostridium sp.]